MRRKIDELNESGDFMDSNDFAVSESNFSQSFRSRDATGKGTTKSQQQKKQFYYYDQQKFTSYNKPNEQQANDDDDF